MLWVAACMAFGVLDHALGIIFSVFPTRFDYSSFLFGGSKEGMRSTEAQERNLSLLVMYTTVDRFKRDPLVEGETPSTPVGCNMTGGPWVACSTPSGKPFDNHAHSRSSRDSVSQ